VWKPDGKRPRGRSRLRWEYNINADILGMGWTYLALCRDRWWEIVNERINFRVP
jgi:hypothetical protein